MLWVRAGGQPRQTVYIAPAISCHLYMMLYDLRPLLMVAVTLRSFARDMPCTQPSRFLHDVAVTLLRACSAVEVLVIPNSSRQFMLFHA